MDGFAGERLVLEVRVGSSNVLRRILWRSWWGGRVVSRARGRKQDGSVPARRALI